MLADFFPPKLYSYSTAACKEPFYWELMSSRILCFEIACVLGPHQLPIEQHFMFKVKTICQSKTWQSLKKSDIENHQVIQSCAKKGEGNRLESSKLGVKKTGNLLLENYAKQAEFSFLSFGKRRKIEL